MAMDSSPPSLSLAQRYVAFVRSQHFSGDVYGEFARILKDFGRRKITSSEAFSTVQTLFRSQNQPDLLNAFDTFRPRYCSAAAKEGSAATAASMIDFVNRVKLRFRGGEVFSEFLNLMYAYSRRTISASDACDKVVELFGGNDDLVEQFRGFLSQSKKRKIGDQNQKEEADCDGESRKKKKRVSNSIYSKISSSEEEERRRAEEKKIVDRDNEMEESMFEIDVRISNLESCRKSAESLQQLLSDGTVTAAEFVVAGHFTALNVACMRREDRKILEHLQRNVVEALPLLIQTLSKNKATLWKKRIKVAQSWSKLRCRSSPSSN